MVKAIEWINGRVIILDQTRLPLEVSYIECVHYRQVAEAIKTLSIRGAPAIGIAAAMGIALHAKNIKAQNYQDFMHALQPVFHDMLSTRPTAVNIKWAVERIKKVLSGRKGKTVQRLKEILIQEANDILEEDEKINKTIGQWGTEFIKHGDRILTHCNAGALATGGYGTATAPMYIAKEQGKRFEVIVDETRPILQGARITAWELSQEGIPVTLITDNTAGALMQKGEIDLVIVGTDRTVRNGDVANKIGTYTIAILSKIHKIPFYVAAPMSSIDFTIRTGKDIPIEERASEEVTHIFGKHQIAPNGIQVRNIAFDVTPHKYITAIITEKGAFKPRDIKKINNDTIDLTTLRLKP